MLSLTLVIKAEEGEGGAGTLKPSFSMHLFAACSWQCLFACFPTKNPAGSTWERSTLFYGETVEVSESAQGHTVREWIGGSSEVCQDSKPSFPNHLSGFPPPSPPLHPILPFFACFLKH